MAVIITYRDDLLLADKRIKIYRVRRCHCGHSTTKLRKHGGKRSWGKGNENNGGKEIQRMGKKKLGKMKAKVQS